MSYAGSAPASTPGLIKTSKFKKRKVKANREKAAAAAATVDQVASVGAGTAGGDASASAVLPQPSHVAEASPVAQMPESATIAEASTVTQTPKPATDAEGSGPAPKPATAEASASAARPKPKPADADAATAPAASQGKGVGADNGGGDGRMKSRKERARNGKGKEVEEDAGRNRKGKKAVGKKEERGDNKGAGFIFMCNAKTKQECYQNRLFGLPSGKIGMVKKIRPGAKLFLYDFDLKLLYGVYKAASNGGLNLVQEAFNGKFPAQVKFKIEKDCLPLPESSIKQAIKENYSARSKFDPELTSRQVHRLLVLFKPVNVPQSAPKNHREERRHYEERRQPYHYEERRPSLPIEAVRQPRFDEERRPAVIHVPLEDPYRAPRFAPLPVEPQLGHSLASGQGDHHRYYQSELAPEPRHIPLALEPRHVPLSLEHHHVPSMPELRHVPAAYYHNLAPSSDSYYRSLHNLVPERYADRTVADITTRDPIIPRDHTRLPGEISARADRLEDLYRTGGIAARGAHVEELYPPGEIAARADRVGISTRADRLEDLYRSDRLVTRAVDPLPRSTYHTAAYGTHPAYAETSTRPVSARVNGPGVPVSSLYSFSGAPEYR
ncbi:hypothetical protein PAHAL_4G263900 [Panicum hallii]|uniref:DCD domain-containing protein n=1 Tax=Panicum hallii TaxID=206008 RepID=A0A2S3HKB5_9POAL|nr:uncharacterized protein LOC112891015 [Panicum hallii]XP_025813694.1 uncharacterized protein LOC112891015 [Panicum hallii]PAN24939.1 hypothetical protein PAHAL_4G263900 [Panicum hallii]